MQKITLNQYLARKEELLRAEKAYNPKCERCKKALTTCYCAKLKSFEPDTKFVILIHQEELRRSVATGRMAHLSLKGSVLFRGSNFSKHETLNQILQDNENHCVLLYPGKKSIPLKDLQTHIPQGKKLVLIILDATWHEARRMYRFSPNLHALPMISFTPESPSQFIVRKQPMQNCYSTIEAIHHVLTRIEPAKNFDGMLDVFSHLVQTQIHFEKTGGGRKIVKSARV